MIIHPDNHELIGAILDNLAEGVVVTDATGRFVVFNTMAERILGLGATESAPGQWAEVYGVFYPDDMTPFPSDQLPLSRALRGESTEMAELFIRNRSVPEGLYIRAIGRPVLDARGEVLGAVVSFLDTSVLRAAHRETERLAATDPLTGLANRRTLVQRLSQLVVEATRGRRFAVAMVDVDHFKQVNDELGHQAGDDLLVAVSEVLRSRLRQTDLLARAGGDEFCALLTDVDEPTAIAVASQLRVAVGTLIRQPITVTISVGVAPYDALALNTADRLIRGADEALYRAKSLGRDRVIRYSAVA